MCFHVVPMHFWLMKAVPKILVSTRLVRRPRANQGATLVWRSILHSLIILPYMQLSVLFGIGALKGVSLDSGIAMVKDRFREGYSFALVYWPWIYIGLYTVVPARYGNLFMDFWALGWYALISFVANKDKNAEVPSWSMIYRKVSAKLN